VDVVTRLREGELRPLRLQAEDGLHASPLNSVYERGEGHKRVRQQYTGRYPFELLQNANDAARDAGERRLPSRSTRLTSHSTGDE
jgi:hypothetical protein